MSCDEVLVESLLELISPVGDVTTKRRFDGVGFFVDEQMFALVHESTFFLKVDELNIAHFEARELEPFVYETTNKHVTLSYYQAPDEALEDGEMMCEWVNAAILAAERAQRRKARRNSERQSESGAKSLAGQLHSVAVGDEAYESLDSHDSVNLSLDDEVA